MEKYIERIWLNPKHSPSTGAMVVFDGDIQWRSDRKAERVVFIEFSDCSGKIRLHITPEESIKDMIKKTELIAAVAKRFADHLRSTK